MDYDREGSDVGYRWFARENLVPAFPFGWGLSYTTFAFVRIDLEPRILARWDDTASAFRIAGGSYTLTIGAHALDEDGPTAIVTLAPHTLTEAS